LGEASPLRRAARKELERGTEVLGVPICARNVDDPLRLHLSGVRDKLATLLDKVGDSLAKSLRSAVANRNGPRGSTCWTPRVDQTNWRPQSSGAGQKDCRTQGSMDGHSSCSSSKMDPRRTDLKAFRMSTYNSTRPVERCFEFTPACTPMATTSHGPPFRNPVWRGPRARAAPCPSDDASSHFATILRRVSPNAMVRTPRPSLSAG